MSEFKKVYVVENNDWAVESVWSTRALADERIAHLTKRTPDYYTVNEWVVDENAPES